MSSPTFLKGYRSLILNFATLVVIAGGALTGQVTDGQTVAIIGSVVAVANLVLRLLTDTAAGKSS